MRGFKAGYYLQKYEPDVLANIMKTNDVIRSDYFVGLAAGRSQYNNEVALNKEIQQERKKEQDIERLKQQRDKKKDNERER